MPQEVEEVFGYLLAHVVPVASERVPAAAALGRVAEKDVTAPRQLPGFRRAAMDGYVCHEGDVRDASSMHPVRLRISGEVRMGEPPGRGPAPGEAWLIPTGGALPLRGDRVVPLEAVRRYGEVLVAERPPEGKLHIAESDEDVPVGTTLVRAGEIIGPAAVGAMVGAAVSDVSVYRQLRAAILSTGDELVEANGVEGPPPGHIVNTNAHMIAGELRAIGCLVDYRGIVQDRPESLTAAFKSATDAEYDVILSTGGVSVGPHDKVPRTWLDLGAKKMAGRVELKPGGPFFAGLLGATWILGLSGSPAAAFAAYHLLARPLLCRLSGRSSFVRPIVPVTLASDLPRRADRFRALWARVQDQGNGRLQATVLIEKTLGILGGLGCANGLLLLRPGTAPLAVGSRIPALLLDRPEDRQGFVVPPAHPAPIIVGVVGVSRGGKTTVIVGLLRRLQAAGLRAIALKHAAHGFEVDQAGSDSARMVEGGAKLVLIVGPEEAAIRLPLHGKRLEIDAVIDLAVATIDQIEGVPPQIVVVEGFRHAGHPIVLVGAPKPDASQDPVWFALPAISELSPTERERALDQLAALLAEKLA